VGLIARTIEEGGVPTLTIGSCRDMMAAVKLPRAVFVDFPLGRQCGRPGEQDLQIRILKDALKTLVEAQVPGEIVDLPYQWPDSFDWESYQRDVQAMIQEEGGAVQQWKP